MRNGVKEENFKDKGEGERGREFSFFLGGVGGRFCPTPRRKKNLRRGDMTFTDVLRGSGCVALPFLAFL